MLLSNLTSNNKINLNIICKYKIIKRFTGNKPVGHARNILAALRMNTSPSSQITLPPTAKKPIEEVPSTEIKTFPEPMAKSFTTITPNVVDKSEHIAKLKSIILKMISSTQPKLDNRLTPTEWRMLQGKEALSQFLHYFETIPLHQVKSNDFFILFQKELTEKDPQILVRSYQLALEIYFRRRQFIENDITLLFDNKISIQDLIGRNQLVVDAFRVSFVSLLLLPLSFLVLLLVLKSLNNYKKITMKLHLTIFNNNTNNAKGTKYWSSKKIRLNCVIKRTMMKNAINHSTNLLQPKRFLGFSPKSLTIFRTNEEHQKIK